MYARHSQVWLSARGWDAAMQAAPPALRDEVAAWAAAGWPLIARRADVDADIGDACLGLPLPPRTGCGTKPRIALRVPQTEVAMVSSPLRLEAIARCTPDEWRPAFDELLKDASGAKLSFSVFGSAALQAITGLPYLTNTSDIDLLFHPCSKRELECAAALLNKHGANLPLDGEFIFPTGDAVSWKEWQLASNAACTTRVLVKGTQAVRLALPAALTATLKDA